MDGNYVAMAVTLVVWVGLFSFVYGLDKRVKEMEKRGQ